jgi:antirestriction protein ArdC
MNHQDELRRSITDQIIAALRAGERPWFRPWSDLTNSGSPANVVSNRPYSGINPLLLDLAARKHNFQSRYWGTFRQWSDLGGIIQKRPASMNPGEWGTKIVYYSPVKKTSKNDDGTTEQVKYFLMKTYTLFNIEQVNGGAVDEYRARPRVSTDIMDYEPAEQAIRATNADIRYGGDRAFYSRVHDYIQIPVKESFISVNEWYSTHFHELAHFSESRLGWEASYASNELVAEIAACYIAAQLDIPQSEDLANHTAYLGSWLKALEDDHRAIFRASTQASKVANYILAFSRGEHEEASEELEGASV